MDYYKEKKLIIRNMDFKDIEEICKADGDSSKDNIEYFKSQIERQNNKEELALLAVYDGKIAGYTFLFYKLKWGGLGYLKLPGVADLMVFPEYRNKGIASKLMDVAEKEATRFNNKIYLEVCLNKEYGPAQRMYAKRGYIPDGKGVYYESKICPTDAECKNDDELTLCLIKELEA